jgi:hypothetical protein
MVISALLATLLLAPQDPPKVTYDDSGEFRLLVMDLERRFKGRVRFEKGLAGKEVSVSLKDAGYYEALDALCRAHKEATYFPLYDSEPRLSQLKLVPGTWIELPAFYHGHFKTMVVGMSRAVRGLPTGDEGGVQVHLALFSPPWIPIGYHACSHADIAVEEAVAANGRDVRIPEDEDPDEQFDMDCAPDLEGPLQVQTIRLRDLELSRGLKVLRGTFKLTAAESKVRRLEATPGSVLETPIGRLRVDEVKEFDRDGDEARWRVVLSVSFKDSVKDHSEPFSRIMERSVFYEGLGGWTSMNFPWKSNSLRIETDSLEKPPRWIDLKIRGAEKTHEVPFKFLDLAFKEEKR